MPENAAYAAQRAQTPPSPPASAYTAQSVPGPQYRTSSAAVGSFVFSLVGILCAGFITGVIAVILGASALSDISKDPQLQGRGLATAGVIIGILDIIGWVIFMMVYVAEM